MKPGGSISYRITTMVWVEKSLYTYSLGKAWHMKNCEVSRTADSPGLRSQVIRCEMKLSHSWSTKALRLFFFFPSRSLVCDGLTTQRPAELNAVRHVASETQIALPWMTTGLPSHAVHSCTPIPSTFLSPNMTLPFSRSRLFFDPSS